MNRDIAERWIAALRSKKFEQGEGLLRFHDTETDKERFCCLGVLCELAVEDGVVERTVSANTAELGVHRYGVEFDDSSTDDTGQAIWSTTNLPVKVLEWAGMRSEGLDHSAYHPDYDGDPDDEVGYDEFTDLNDSGKFNFDQIAEVIDEQWPGL